MFKVGIPGLTQDVKYIRLLPTKTTHNDYKYKIICFISERVIRYSEKVTPLKLLTVSINHNPMR